MADFEVHPPGTAAELGRLRGREREPVGVLQTRAQELVRQHGGVRMAARVIQTDPGHLSRILSGEKEPSDVLARRMGLQKATVYRREHEGRDDGPR